MKRYALIQLLLFSLVSYVVANQQNFDSLINLAQSSTEDTIKLNTYVEIATGMRYVYPDSAFYYTKLAEELAIKYKNYSKLGTVHNIYGAYYWVKGDMKQAIQSFHLAFENYRTANFNHKLGGVLLNIAMGYNSVHEIDSVFHYIELAKDAALKYGDTTTYFTAIGLQIPIYTDQGNFDIAIEIGLESLKHAQEAGDNLLLYYAYSNLGATYYKTGDYDKTEEYHLIALDYAIKIGTAMDEASASANLGLLYSTMGDYDNAIKYYERALKINESFQNPTQFIVTSVNMAVMYNDTHKYKEAIQTLSEALKNAKAFNAARFMPNIFLTRAYAYKGLDNLTKTEQNVNEAINWAHKTGKVKILTDAYQIKTTIDSTRGNYLNALRYKDSAQKYIDSIGNTNVRNRINELNVKYAAEEKEHENALLKKNNEAKEIQISKQNIIINTSIIVGALILLLLVVIVISRIRLQKRNKLILQQSAALEQSLEEIQTLSEFKNDMTQMLVHDLKNPLNALLNLPDMVDVPERREMLKYSAQKMHTLVVNILDVNKYEEANIPVIPELFDLLEVWNSVKNQYTYIVQEKSLSVQDKIPPNMLIEADKGLIERVFSNIFSNAINHTKINGKIIVGSELKDKKTIRVEISDNGYGIEKDRLANIFDQYAQGEHKVAFSTGIGLTFCKRAVEAHGGTIGIESEVDKGTTISFEIPVKQQTVKMERDTQNVFLSKEDKKKLKPLYEDLKNVDLNETTGFRKLFLEMEAMEIESEPWVSALKVAFYQPNAEIYSELVNQIQQK